MNPTADVGAVTLLIFIGYVLVKDVVPYLRNRHRNGDGKGNPGDTADGLELRVRVCETTVAAHIAAAEGRWEEVKRRLESLEGRIAKIEA